MDAPRRPLLKVIILGDSGVGKTSLLNRYVSNKFSSLYRKTIGADFFTKDVIVGDKVVTMQIWDTVGQERFQSLGVAFYRGADCVVLVYDVTSSTSYDSLKLWKDEFVIQGAPNDPKKFPFVILANKIDLGENDFSGEKYLGFLNCDYEVPYFETSAKDNINVEHAFTVAAKMALEREKEEDAYNLFPEILNQQETKKHNTCLC